MDLARLYDDHAQALHAFLLNVTRDEAATRDLLQEVFVRVVRQPALLEGVTAPRSFLIRVAHRLALDRFRRETTRQRYHEAVGREQGEIFDASPDPDEAAFRQALSEALGELPADQRVVVHLKLWEGMTFEAIAETLEASPNTVASRYRYGLDKLRARLRPLYEELR